MGVGIYTYGTTARTQVLIGDLVAGRLFTTETLPTLTQMEGLLDDVAAEMNAVLTGAGYTVDTAALVATNYPRTSDYLAMLNSVGAAALVLQTLPSIAYTAGVEGEGGGRLQMLQARYKAGLKMIEQRRLSLGRSAIRVKANQRLDEDGNEKEPLFRRDDDFYPGTRPTDEDDEEA